MKIGNIMQGHVTPHTSRLQSLTPDYRRFIVTFIWPLSSTLPLPHCGATRHSTSWLFLPWEDRICCKGFLAHRLELWNSKLLSIEETITGLNKRRRTNSDLLQGFGGSNRTPPAERRPARNPALAAVFGEKKRSFQFYGECQLAMQRDMCFNKGSIQLSVCRQCRTPSSFPVQVQGGL